MSGRTVKHEIKLHPLVIVVLGMLAIGLFANSFKPVFSIQETNAQLLSPAAVNSLPGATKSKPFYIHCVSGC